MPGACPQLLNFATNIMVPKNLVAMRIGKHQPYTDSEKYCALYNEEGCGACWS